MQIKIGTLALIIFMIVLPPAELLNSLIIPLHAVFNALPRRDLQLFGIQSPATSIEEYYPFAPEQRAVPYLHSTPNSRSPLPLDTETGHVLTHTAVLKAADGVNAPSATASSKFPI